MPPRRRPRERRSYADDSLPMPEKRPRIRDLEAELKKRMYAIYNGKYIHNGKYFEALENLLRSYPEHRDLIYDLAKQWPDDEAGEHPFTSVSMVRDFAILGYERILSMVACIHADWLARHANDLFEDVAQEPLHKMSAKTKRRILAWFDERFDIKSTVKIRVAGALDRLGQANKVVFWKESEQ